jgi:hypothetical protein
LFINRIGLIRTWLVFSKRVGAGPGNGRERDEPKALVGSLLWNPLYREGYRWYSGGAAKGLRLDDSTPSFLQRELRALAIQKAEIRSK